MLLRDELDNGNHNPKYTMEEYVDKRWNTQECDEDEADVDNSTARQFERSRIKALSGKFCLTGMGKNYG